jgi:acetyl-CoA C-acetyltransferase
MKSAYIYAAKRTPIGSFQGSLSTLSAPQLGAVAAKAAVAQSGISASDVDELISGCVLSAGVGQAPARQVGIFAGLPHSFRAMTINKVCGSGLKAVALAADRIRLEQAQWVLAGGTENMSQAPYYLKSARQGFRMGHQEVLDGMIHDGLWDVYNNFHMGSAAELCVKEYKFSREAQDAFALQSYQKALKSIESGLFTSEIESVAIPSKKETITVAVDEEPGRGKLDGFAKLRPAFSKDGSVTAANASSINDGAAFVVVGAEDKSKKPLARIIHTTEFAQAPEWFTTAPVGAMKKLLKEASVSVGDIASFEVNEAFAAVAMAAQRELEIPESKLNPRGGAVALGHPIGASGARLLVTLLHTLRSQEKGVVTLCIGGGEAIAMLVEKI